MIKSLKIIFCIILFLPICYFIVAITLTYITVNTTSVGNSEAIIYLKTNGVHLDIIIPSNSVSVLKIKSKYVAVGWGDKDFYLTTPKLKDVTFLVAFKAMFLESQSLLHLTKYNEINTNWVKVNLTNKQFNSVLEKINGKFEKDNITRIDGYGSSDFFMNAKGSYSCLFTCNTWVNSVFKDSGVKSCFWTPFSDRLLEIHR